MTYLTIDDQLSIFLKHISLFIKDPTLFADILSTYGLLPKEARDQVSDARVSTNHMLFTAFISFILQLIEPVHKNQFNNLSCYWRNIRAFFFSELVIFFIL